MLTEWAPAEPTSFCNYDIFKKADSAMLWWNFDRAPTRRFSFLENVEKQQRLCRKICKYRLQGIKNGTLRTLRTLIRRSMMRTIALKDQITIIRRLREPMILLLKNTYWHWKKATEITTKTLWQTGTSKMLQVLSQSRYV